MFERQAEEKRDRLLMEENTVKTLASFMARTEKAAREVKKIQFVSPPVDSTAEVTSSGKVVGMIPFERVGAMFGG